MSADSDVRAHTEQHRQAKTEAELEAQDLRAEHAQLEKDLAEAEAQIAEVHATYSMDQVELRQRQCWQARHGWQQWWSLDHEGIGDARQLEHEPPQVTTATIESHNLAPVYENQRRSLVQVFGGADFSATNLLSAERQEWTDAGGAPSERARLPAGWHWVVDRASGAVDAEGWQYAWNFWTQGWSSSPSAAFGQTAWVRRRKWVPALKKRSSLPRLLSRDLATPAGRAAPTAPRHRVRTTEGSRRLSESSRQRRSDASADNAGFYCIVEVVGARGLRPGRRRNAAVPAIFRLTLGDQVYQSPVRPNEPTANPVWAEQGEGQHCRHLFHLSVPNSGAATGLDGMNALMLQFAHPRTGVKVRHRFYFGGTSGLPKSHPSTFIGAKAINWLTGLHRRGHTGAVPADSRQTAIEICQHFLENGWIYPATNTFPSAVNNAFQDSSSTYACSGGV